MSVLNAPPPMQAPKSKANFLKFEPFPASGPQILTLVASNYIPVHEFENDKGEKYNGEAIELFFGAMTDAGPRFVKTWPKAYSLKNNSFYYKVYKAISGKEPVTGCKPDDIYGGGIQGTIEVQDKVSAKGTKYRTSNLDPKSVAAVFPQLRSAITPLAQLKPALDAILAKQAEGDKGTPETNTEAPF